MQNYKHYKAIRKGALRIHSHTQWSIEAKVTFQKLVEPIWFPSGKRFKTARLFFHDS